MEKFSKTNFQDIHYQRKNPSFLLKGMLSLAEFFYKNIINLKNKLYERNILTEQKTPCYVICIGNLTTGGVGKTPIVTSLANKLSKNEPIAVISRGYKAKLNNKNPNVIKDFNGLNFKNGSLCGDEPFQLAKKTSDNVVVITCKNRLKAVNLAYEKYKINSVILDDGFSNRTIKKDKTILVIDSKMRFGNSKLLPSGPLREPIEQIKRADEIILVDKNDENIKDAISWAKSFNKKLSICKMKPKRIYNLATKADIKFIKKQNAIAICAIGQPEQFYNFAKEFYNVKEKISFPDHYSYSTADIKKLTSIADKNNTNILITTQKDETKILNLAKEFPKYNFYVLELENTFEEVN